MKTHVETRKGDKYDLVSHVSMYSHDHSITNANIFSIFI